MAEGIIEAKKATIDDFRQTEDEVETQVKVLLGHKEEQTRRSFHVVTVVKPTVQDNVQHFISSVMCVKSLTILRECVGRVQEISGILRHIYRSSSNSYSTSDFESIEPDFTNYEGVYDESAFDVDVMNNQLESLNVKLITVNVNKKESIWSVPLTTDINQSIIFDIDTAAQANILSKGAYGKLEQKPKTISSKTTNQWHF